jgi:hypothetical protein
LLKAIMSSLVGLMSSKDIDSIGVCGGTGVRLFKRVLLWAGKGAASYPKSGMLKPILET